MNILVGYDGSSLSTDVLKLARHRSETQNATIYVVRSMPKNSQYDEIEEAKNSLAYAEELFQIKAVPCKTYVLIRGLSPGEDLVKFAGENYIDEIMVGVRKRSKVGKLLMGSTAQYVILNAPCPVVTLK